MKLKNYFFAITLAVAFSTIALAATNTEETLEDKIASFRDVGDIAPAQINVPTVVDIPLNMPSSQMGVFDTADHSFTPYVTIRKNEPQMQIVSNKSRGEDAFLNDRNYDTSVDFDLPEDHAGEATLTFTSTEPFAADALWLGLARHVAMPENIEIRAEIDGVERIVVAESDKKGICGECVLFPLTVSSKWQVKLRYGQPLRLSEISFRHVSKSAVDASFRFLMQPGHAYRIFREPDRALSLPVGEAGDLRTDKDILSLGPVAFQPNAAYRESDADKDGLPDARDNCVFTANPDQADINGNLRGDVCDDFDRDGVMNSLDNCSSIPNASQQDIDSDKIGDACDKEESRLTEKYSWLPWIALAGVAALLLFFFFRVAKGMPKDS